MNMILASSSSARKELMDRLQITYESISPQGVDESATLEQTNLSFIEKAQKLALLKAQSVALSHPDALVIGSDQVGEVHGHLLEKPLTLEKAKDQLKLLSGKTHYLHTAVALVQGKNIDTFVVSSTMTMTQLDEKQIQEYLKKEDVLHCAGSYKIEGLGISLFESIDTSDFTSIIGLPMVKLCHHLRKRNLL